MGFKENDSKENDSKESEISENNVVGIPSDGDLDEEDFDHFIEEMQRIIHESPAGMQARFARTISYLKQRKKDFIAESTHPLTKKELYDQLLEIIKELEKNHYGKDKFKTLLDLARLREQITEEKTQKLKPIIKDDVSNDGKLSPNDTDSSIKTQNK